MTDGKYGLQRDPDQLPKLDKQGAEDGFHKPTRRLVNQFATRYFQKAIKIMDRVSDNALGILAKPIDRDHLKSACYNAVDRLNDDDPVREVHRELMGLIAGEMTSEQIRSADMVVRRVIPDLHVVVNEMTINDEFTSKDTILDKMALIFRKQPSLIMKIIDSEPTLREEILEHLTPKPVQSIHEAELANNPKLVE